MYAIGKAVWALKIQAQCCDGKERTAFARSYWDGKRLCGYGDTYFTIPAFVRTNGKRVSGFVMYENERAIFVASKEGRNSGLISA